MNHFICLLHQIEEGCNICTPPIRRSAADVAGAGLRDARKTVVTGVEPSITYWCHTIITLKAVDRYDHFVYGNTRHLGRKRDNCGCMVTATHDAGFPFAVLVLLCVADSHLTSRKVCWNLAMTERFSPMSGHRTRIE